MFELKIFLKKRWVRLLLLVTCLFLLYVFVMWGMGNLVDKSRLRQNMIDWVVARLNYTSEVNCGDVDLAVRMNTRTDLYLHDFELDTPNPRFALPWLYVGTFRASTPLHTLVGEFDARPVIQVRDAIFRLNWNDKGVFNLSGLGLHDKDWDLPFLKHMDVKGFEVPLMMCRVLVDKPEFSSATKINGLLRVAGNSLALSASGLTSYDLSSEGARRRFLSEFKISKCNFTIPDFSFKTFSGSIENFPLVSLNSFLSSLPQIPSGALISGDIICDENKWGFSGKLAEGNIGDFRDGDVIRASVNTALKGGATVGLEMNSPDSSRVFALSAVRKDDSWGSLMLHFKQVNVSAALNPSALEWFSFVVRDFCSARVTAEQAVYEGFEVQRPVFDIVCRKKNAADLSMSGYLGGGQVSLVAKKLSLEKSSMPESILGVLSIKNASDTMPHLIRYIPELYRCNLVSGTGEVAVSYDKVLSDKRGNVFFSLRLSLNDVRISGITGGLLVRTLAGIEDSMIELENLSRRASVSIRESVLKSSKVISEIKFKSLKISYEIAPGGGGRLRGVVASSPDIGEVEAVGEQLEDGGFRLRLFLKKVPASLIEGKAFIGSRMKKILRTLSDSKGLEYICFYNETGGVVNPLFIQDAFRIWSEGVGDSGGGNSDENTAPKGGDK